MIGTATQWIGNGLVSYFLVPILKQVGITKPAQTAGINGGIAIWSWWAAMAGATLSDKFGRRALFLTSLCYALVCFISITALSGAFATTHHTPTGVAMIPFLFLFNASYAIAFTPIPLLYVPEISPFSLRAKSAALLLLSQNIAQAFNQFVNPIALKAIAWKYFIVYVGVISMYLILFFLFCRETKGLTVEEAAMVYESSSRKKPAENVEVGRLGHHSSADEGLDEDYKKTELSHVEESAR
jgi:MFS family permease